MDKITKKTIRRIKAGFHDDLIEAIEFLIETYDEDKFDAGYKCCMYDIEVYSGRLAKHIQETLENKVWSTDDLERLISDFLIDEMNKTWEKKR